MTLASPQQIAHFAGYTTAHAVWSLNDSRRLTCLVGLKTMEGKRDLTRLKNRSHHANVEEARSMIAKSLGDGASIMGVLVYEGYLVIDDGKQDAILVEGFVAESTDVLKVGIPYEPASAAGPFRIGKPRFLDVDAATYHQMAADFFSGVETHTDGCEVWKAAIPSDVETQEVPTTDPELE